MTQKLINYWLLSLAFFVVSLRLQASPAVDKIYALRRIVPFVINVDLDPVFGEHVETQMKDFFKSRAQFEVSAKGLEFIKSELKKIPLHGEAVPTDAKMGFWFKQPILELQNKEVDAVVVCELKKQSGRYQLHFLLSTTNAMEFVLQKKVNVENGQSLDSFSEAVKTGLNHLVHHIPFDASIIARNGYRVVIDQGKDSLVNESELPVYSLEESMDEKTGEPRLFMEETGIVKITEVGEKISFGTIQVERKPKEVSVQNKLVLANEEAKRDPAYVLFHSPGPHPELGYFDLSLGMSLVTVGNTTSSGSAERTTDTLFPTGNLHSEVWLTPQTSASLNLSYAMGTLGASAGSPLSSSTNDLALLFNYRFGPLERTAYGPYAILRAGYLRHQFKVDVDAISVPYTSATTSGLAVGGGAGFNVTPKVSIGFDIMSILLASFSESPLTSGDETKNVSGWDFSLKGTYRFNEKFDFLVRLSFAYFGAEFSGNGTRPTPIASSSQSSKTIFTGAAYYF